MGLGVGILLAAVGAVLAFAVNTNVNGVNMDDEMSLMLQVERTFGASSKLISTIDSMVNSLLAAV